MVECCSNVPVCLRCFSSWSKSTTYFTRFCLITFSLSRLQMISRSSVQYYRRPHTEWLHDRLLCWFDLKNTASYISDSDSTEPSSTY
jgi:hypothetical protein